MKKTITPGFRILFVALLSLCGITATSQVVINEYSCSNFESFPDNYDSFEDWIELYNPGASAINIGGYFLSDKPDAPMTWQIPAGTTIPANGFKLFWASGRDESNFGSFHTNFKLTQTKPESEKIVFADPYGNILDSLEVSVTQKAHSNGRILNGDAVWGVFTNPSPGTSNNLSTVYTRYAEQPSMSIEGGFYDEAVIVEFSTNEPNSVIRYTTNGNEPGPESPVYTMPISVLVTKILKAKVFSNDETILPSLIEYNTYFINEDFTVPVVSIAANDLITLLNGSYDTYPWGTIEYFNTDKVRTTKGYGEFDKHGQDSWVHDQRSLDYKMRDECGYNYGLLENLFKYTDRDEYQKIILRASGDDNYPGIDSSAHIRDDFIQTISVKSGMNLDERKSSRCVVFANGQYWGVYAIREKVNDHDFTKYYYDQDKFNLHYLMLWGGTWAEYGGQSAFNDWNMFYSYVMGNNMADSANWAYVEERLDPASITDYMLINSFVVCSDWLNWNVGWWRGLNPEGGHRRWGYILWDEDATFGHYYNYTGIPAQTPYVTPCFHEALSGGSDPEGHIQLLNKLRTNPDFEQYYVTRYADLLNTTLKLNYLLPLFDSLAGVIEPEMYRHVLRWGGSVDQWTGNVQRIRDFMTRRYNFVKEAIMECYNLTGPYNLQVDVSPPGKGMVKLNSLDLKDFPWSGTYYGGIDTKLSAVESDQYYKFDHWEVRHSILPGSDSIKDISFRLSSSDTILAVYVPRVFADSLVIHEINYNSAAGFDPGDWVEFYNPHGYDLDISNWVFKDEDDLHIFTFAEGTVIEPFGLIVVANDMFAFHNLFPDVVNYTGPMGYGLSGSGELLRLYDETGALIDTVHYDDNLPWPLEPDGNGPTLELINPGLDNALGESWKTSGEPHGTPGEYNSPNVGTTLTGIRNNPDSEIWPNPFHTTAVFTVNSDTKIEDGSLSIYSSTGFEAARYENINTIQTAITTKGLHPGIWFYRFVSNSGSVVVSGKMMVE
ncbi:MAG: CotH kinase family protein [Bacteroidales bacterium]|nr:CotH kinase family protein [Bacteroidales bacterium]